MQSTATLACSASGSADAGPASTAPRRTIRCPWSWTGSPWSTGAEDEPLLPLVESLLGCTGALARGTPMADISLPESGLVLCLDNGEDSCTLRIASLARPARLVRRVRLDWAEWCEAVVKLGETFATDLEGSAVPAASRRAVRDRLRALCGSPPGSLPRARWLRSGSASAPPAARSCSS